MKHTAMVWQKEYDADFAVGHDKNGKVIGAEKRSSARAAGSMVLATTIGDAWSPLKWMGYYDQH